MLSCNLLFFFLNSLWLPPFKQTHSILLLFFRMRIFVYFIAEINLYVNKCVLLNITQNHGRMSCNISLFDIIIVVMLIAHLSIHLIIFCVTLQHWTKTNFGKKSLQGKIKECEKCGHFEEFDKYFRINPRMK